MTIKPVTEVAYITLKAGVDIEKVGTPEHQLWEESMTTVSSQEGYQRAYFGLQLESPNTTILFIDWDSVSAHQKFTDSPAYGPFAQKLSSLMEAFHLHHFQPTPFPPSIHVRASCTEVATFYNTSPQFVSNVRKFIQTIEGKAEGYLGSSFGGVVEEISKHTDADKECTEKGKAVMLVIGWGSKEVHMKFRESSLFKENIHYLREGMRGVEMFHVVFKAV